MKKYIPYLATLVLGMVIGWLWREHHFADAGNMIQRDTVVRFDTIHYSRIDLSESTMKLDVPKIGTKELVYLETSSLDTIYRDSVRYVTLPREYFFTKTEDAEIWHSGIDSRIDSLNIVRKNVKITEQTSRKNVKNSVSIGIEANYAEALRTPIQLQYAYKIIPWLSIYGYAEYELITHQMGVGIGTSITIEY